MIKTSVNCFLVLVSLDIATGKEIRLGCVMFHARPWTQFPRISRCLYTHPYVYLHALVGL